MKVCVEAGAIPAYSLPRRDFAALIAPASALVSIQKISGADIALICVENESDQFRIVC